MAEKLVVCVTTVSEGKNSKVISELKEAIELAEGSTLLHVSDGSTNRSIFTYCGTLESVVGSSFNLAKTAYEITDMTSKLPCIGAVDNFSFFPGRDVSLKECQLVAQCFAKKLSTELKVPVYFDESSDENSRKCMLPIRNGQYEKLNKNENQLNHKPQYGPELPCPHWGATIVWAGEGFLHSNVNLLATKEQAQRIALNVAEFGRGFDQPGPLKGCSALGNWLEDKRIAQVAMTLQDLSLCTLHKAYDQVKNEANGLVLPVLGMTVVGMLPLKCLIDVADFYIARDNLYVLEEDHKVALAAKKLGLNSMEAFIPEERIIEYRLPSDPRCPLIQKTLKDFIRTVGARVPVPAGGSAAATVGALGAALSAMVAKMTYGKKQWEKFDSQMRRLIPVVHEAMEEMMNFIDSDTAAFNELLAGLRLPKSTAEEADRRKSALYKATIHTIEVPMDLARSASKTWKTVEELAHIITAGAISDLRVSAWFLEVAVKAAHSSIMENVRDLQDLQYKNQIVTEIEELLQKAKIGREAVHKVLAQRSH